MKYLLDTNAWIAYLRKNDPHMISRFQKQPPTDLALCAVVLGELLYGADHSGAANQVANLTLIADLQKRFASLPFDDVAADEYGQLRHHLASLGTPIGPNCTGAMFNSRAKYVTPSGDKAGIDLMTKLNVTPGLWASAPLAAAAICTWSYVL